MTLFSDDYEPERQRQEASIRDREERALSCGLDPWEAEERASREWRQWKRRLAQIDAEYKAAP